MQVVREATENDVDACLALFEIGHQDAPSAYEDFSPISVVTDLELGRILVAEDEGRIVGMISSIPTHNRVMLYMLIVDREHRGRTVAPVLVRAAAKRWGKVAAIIVPHARKTFEMAGMELSGYMMESRET